MTEKSLLTFSLLVMVFSSLLIHPFDGLYPYDEKRALQSLLFGLLVIPIILIGSWRKNWLIACQLPPRFIFVLLSICLILGLGSSSQALNPYFALLDVAVFVMLLFTIITASATSRLNQNILPEIIVPFLALCLCLYLYIVLIGYFMIHSGTISIDQRELIINFSNERFFNQFQSWYLPLLFAPLLNPAIHKYLRYLIFSSAAGSWFLIFVSAPRGTVLGLVVACLLVSFLFKKQAMRWMKYFFSSLLVGFALYYLLFHLLPLLTAESASGPSRVLDTESSNERLIMWGESLQQIIQTPLLGIGPAHFPCISNLPYSHPHSSLVQLTLEWGIPAMLCLLSIFCYATFHWTKASKERCLKNPHTAALEISLLTTLIAAATHSLVSGIIVTPLSQFMGAVIIGWMVGIHFKERPPLPSQPLRGYIVLSITIAALFIIGSEVFSYLQLNDELRYLESSGGGPRFWIHGNICPE